MSEVWVEYREKLRLGLEADGCLLPCRGRGRTPRRGPGPRGRACLVVQNGLRGRHEPLFRRVLRLPFDDHCSPVAMHNVQTHVATERSWSALREAPDRFRAGRQAMFLGRRGLSDPT